MSPYLGNPLSGKELKVSIGEITGCTIIFRNSTGAVTGYGGYYYEQLSWLALRLNFSLDMKPQKDVDFGTLINGSWTGMRGELQRKEVDIVCSPFSGLPVSDVMDLAIYTGDAGYGIITKYPKPQTSLYGHIMPFSFHVWLGLLLSIVACIGCLELIAIFDRKYLSQRRYNNGSLIGVGLTTMSRIAIYIFATLTNHGGYYQNYSRRYAVGMMAFTWCLATFVFVNIYSSCLTSYLSLTFQRPDINSFKDLAANPNYQLLTLKQSTGETILLEAKSGPMKEIGDRLRSCPKDVCRVNNFDKIIGKILEEDNVVGLITFLFGENYMLKTIVNHECRLTMAHAKMAVYHYYMATQKNSPYTSLLFKESFQFREYGLRDYWLEKTVPKTTQCDLKYNSNGEFVHLVDRARLQLKQFYLAFAVLFAGYALAFIQFLREHFIHRG